MDNEARTIIDNLLSDSELYQKMSEKEGEVWGRIFSNQKRNDALIHEQAAAQQLRINRNLLNLPFLLKNKSIFPEKGLSLACGGGRAERQLIKQGICQSFHGIDISENALSEARKKAKEGNLNITYEQGDLNHLELPEKEYDLVVTQNCLHHVLRLEDLADQIFKSMRPDGVLWIHDYIGETQFQYSDERLYWVNSILSLLPEQMKIDTVNNRVLNKVVRKKPGTLVSPFESIRSSEIVPIFLERFDVIEKFEFDSILRFVCGPGTRESFLTDEISQSLFEILFFLDKVLIEKGILTPCAGQYLLKLKR